MIHSRSSGSEKADLPTPKEGAWRLNCSRTIVVLGDFMVLPLLHRAQDRVRVHAPELQASGSSLHRQRGDESRGRDERPKPPAGMGGRIAPSGWLLLELRAVQCAQITGEADAQRLQPRLLQRPKFHETP